MKSHRTIWGIAGAASLLALTAFFLRQNTENLHASQIEAAQRDQLVTQMLERLNRDHRARFAETRRLVERLATYCDSPRLATAETWYARGLKEMYGESNLKAARAAFERSAQMRPDWAWPVNALGIVEFVEGHEDEALKDFGRALSMAPGWSRPHSDMTILYRRAGNLDAALDHALKALAMEPDDLVNQFNYGVILDDLGRHMEARKQYEGVLSSAPEMAQAAYNLACSYAREGNAKTALPYLKRALEADRAFREDAADDPDFDPIRRTPDFEALISGAASQVPPATRP